MVTLVVTVPLMSMLKLEASLVQVAVAVPSPKVTSRFLGLGQEPTASKLKSSRKR